MRKKKKERNEKNIMIMNFMRHGDRNFRSLKKLGLDAIPSGLKPSSHKIVGFGESTHRHRADGQCVVYDLEKPQEITYEGRTFLVDQYVQVKEPLTVTHEEHGPRPLMPGMYAVLPEQEVDVLEQKTRSVLD